MLTGMERDILSYYFLFCDTVVALSDMQGFEGSIVSMSKTFKITLFL